MKLDLVAMGNLLITNGVIMWLTIWIIKRIDKLEERIEQHETRLTIAEKEIEHIQLYRINHYKESLHQAAVDYSVLEK